MTKNGCYIGAQNGVVFCIDSNDTKGKTGRLYHGYTAEPVMITGMEELVVKMDRFFDELGIPFPGTNERTFLQQKKNNKSLKGRERMIRVKSDEELLKAHGDKGTFIIRVQHRQHSSWQGIVTWVDQDKTVPFRSALELIKLIDGALEDDAHIEIMGSGGNTL